MSKKPHILLVDDSDDFRETVTTRLISEGFEVTGVSSGREGLEKAGTMNFDLILLDMVMPDKDGVTTYQELRARPRTKEVPIILLTGVAVEGHWEPMQYESDSRAFVMGKPYDHSTLLGRINQLLAQVGGQA